MKRLTLKAKVREPGASGAKLGRREGKVPAIVYGAGKENVAVFVDDITLRKVVKEGGAQALITLEIEGLAGEDAESLAILKEVQYDAFGENILHTDFYRVTLGKPINVAVPLIAVGEPPGVEAGGILEYLTREVNISCLPREIPEYLEINVDNLDLNENLAIADVGPPSGITILDDPSILVVSVKPSRIARLAEIEEAEAAAVEAAKAEVEAEPEAEETRPPEEGAEAEAE